MEVDEKYEKKLKMVIFDDKIETLPFEKNDTDVNLEKWYYIQYPNIIHFNICWW